MDPNNKAFSAVFEKRGFINLWVNQIIVQLSYNSLNFALLLWIFKLTDSNTAVSALMLAVYLPAVFFGVFAGIFVDIFDRKKIINLINFLMSSLFLGLIFFKSFYPAVLLITFFINTLGIFYLSSEASAIPLLVSKQKLLMANSVFSVTVFFIFLFGYGLSGPVMANFGVDFIFAAGAALLFLGFLLSLLMPSIAGELDPESSRLKISLEKGRWKGILSLILGEAKKTLNIFATQRQVKAAILILSGEQAIIGILAVLMPSFFEKVLKVNATDASLVLILPLGLGMITGGLLLGRLGQNINKFKLIGSGVGIAGVLLGLLGFGSLLSPFARRIVQVEPFFYRLPHSTMLSLGAFLLGLALVSVIVPSQTIIQEQTPEGSRGKAFSFLTTCTSALALLPVLLIGSLSDLVGPAAIFIGIGIFLGPIAFMLLSRFPQRRYF